MYYDVIFADRSSYPLTMFENRVLMKLSRLLHFHIAYETDIAKIIAVFCRISYCFEWLYRVELNRLPSLNEKMYDDVVFAE